MSRSKPWGGRFQQPTDHRVESFTLSLDFDRRLYAHDIRGSIAHARMLAHVGVLTGAECDDIVSGLGQIKSDIEKGEFEWLPALEDVHMNIELRLTERIGEAGKKLHTGRSRNDQVATDLRLYLRDAVDEVISALVVLQSDLVDVADAEAETIMPGFTHMQVAQPVTVGHHLMAWSEMLERDVQRLFEARRRINVMPLGSAALAGTSFPIDRAFTARELGFDLASANSLDAVSDRDFVIEFIADAAILMVHLSRIAEELILWSSEPFGYIQIGDAFCTGSSIMPQKKNPDVAELARAKSGRVFGHLVAILTVMKGQPLAYNRDNQEDKEPAFDTVDTVLACLEVMHGMMPEIHFQRERLAAAAQSGYSTATDLAEYLVGKGVPFRDAHETVGKTVRYALEQHKSLSELSLEELRRFSGEIGADVFDRLTIQGSVAARTHLGGTAPSEVRRSVHNARERLIRQRELLGSLPG